DLGTGGKGWTVAQRRVDGSVNFDRPWVEYKQGFGNKEGEFWLGLEKIHAMTSQRRYRLRFDMEDFEGNTSYAEYDDFKVADEPNYYRLEAIGNYTGDAGDSLRLNLGHNFTTKDFDNDDFCGANCAMMKKGGWWFTNCTDASPNGEYSTAAKDVLQDGMYWRAWRNWQALRKISMKMRPF
ncbi:predicted protein, partial [Nematostella vectensis]